MVTSEHPGVLAGEYMDRGSDFAPGLELAFAHCPDESSYFIQDIRGKVPAYIRGSYYLNGPARFCNSGLHYRHWLDGDGMVCRLRFDNSGVHFANRYVRTAKFDFEQTAGRPLFRTFGTAFPGDALKRGIGLESPGNVSVYPFHGILLAFGEQSLPWRLEPHTLDTVGMFDFGGALNEMSPFAAHPKFDPITGEMFNFGTFFSGQHPKLCLYCFDKKGHLRRRTSHALSHRFSIHDFGLSPSYLVFYVSPYLLDIDAMIHDSRSVMDSLQWRPEMGSQLLIFSRENAELVASASLPARYCLHLINCFEQQGHLMVDLLELERPVYDQYHPLPSLFTDVAAGGPVRLAVDLKDNNIVKRYELGYRSAPDFPAVDPTLVTQTYDELWMLGISKTGQRGRKFFDELVHANWTSPQVHDIFRAAPGRYFSGEPVFIAGSGPSEAVVICQQFDAKRGESSFLLFDAYEVNHGPVATLRLRQPVHLGFHASFDPAPLSR